jgi:hypothetical protein
VWRIRLCRAQRSHERREIIASRDGKVAMVNGLNIEIIAVRAATFAVGRGRCVISRRRNNPVAFGAKRTSNRIYEYSLVEHAG